MMAVTVAKWVVVIFGVCFTGAGLLMFLKPKKASNILRKAGSTNFINYAEITLRMIPAAALIVAAPLFEYPLVFSIVGWFMLATSLVLYFVPRRLHHNFSLKAADILKPVYFRMISPFAVMIGLFIIHSIL